VKRLRPVLASAVVTFVNNLRGRGKVCYPLLPCLCLQTICVSGHKWTQMCF